MKKTYFLFLLLAVLLISLPTGLDAQTRNRKNQGSSKVDKYFDESQGIAHRLWYGGGFNLGFSGSNLINVFNIGISPMVGFKLIDPVSIGPRFSFQYTSVKGLASDNNIRKVQPLSYSAGLFTRYKFLPMIFAQVEYEYENSEYPLITGVNGVLVWDNTTQEVATVREARDNVYVGLGYTSGLGYGTLGYEIMLLYNILEPEDSLDLPFSIRFGLTFGF
ncbi:MAG: hypothetical protein KDC44_13130 [Phaeodactylibacter sp.]|nr:hypothetical protein [Phaeodactylibacter sp.]